MTDLDRKGGTMAIKELTDEQVHTMTLEQKDEWWLKNVYKGNMPQLNLSQPLRA